MNAKTLAMLGMIFVLTFSLSGCNGEEDTSTTGGTVGLTLEFQPGAPPSQISEDDISFDISVKLENEGEYDLDPVIYAGDTDVVESGDLVAIFLLGVNPATLGLCDSTGKCHTDLVYEEGLGGAHYVNEELIPGELTYKSWVAFDKDDVEILPNYKLDITSDQNMNFVAQLCYPYVTISTATACFSGNAYAQATGAETCVVSGDKEVTSTIAPIQVTKLVENPAGKNSEGDGRYAFTFTIENVGDGSVFPYTKPVTSCTKLNVADLNANQVAVTRVLVGGVEKEECLRKSGVDELGDPIYVPAGVTLVDGVGTYTCTLTQSSVSGDYSDIVEIDLLYNYYTQTKKIVTVKNTLDFE